MTANDHNHDLAAISIDSDFYRNIMDQARDIILVVAPDGKIIDANKAAMNAYGYSINELLCLHIQNLRSPKTRKAIDAQLKIAQQQGILFRTVHLRKNGEAFPVEVGSQLVQFSAGRLAISIIRDITATVTNEIAFRDNEEKLFHLYQELMAAHEELTASDEELRQQFDELLTKEEAITRQNAILQSLHDTARGLMNRHETDDLLKRIVIGATELVGTPHGFIYHLDKQKNVFCRSHGIGIYEKDIGREIPIDQGIVGVVYRTGEPVFINEYPAWLEHHPESPQFEELCAELQIPLTSEGHVVGTIGLAYCENNKVFGSNELDSLSQFAELASIALDNAMLVTSYKNELQERRQAEEALIVSDSKHRAIFENANDIIYILDLVTGDILDVNRRACELYGYTREEILSGDFNVIGTEESPYSESEARDWIRRAADGQPQLFEWKNKHRDGHFIWVEINLKRALIGKEDRILAIVRDISERKAQEQAIRLLAYYDDLTGLPNRVTLQERLAQELNKACRGETTGAALFVDLDDLKMINDTLGHFYGDDVITKAGTYLLAAAGKNAMVARISGDEFIVLLLNESNREMVAAVADNMIKSLNRDYEIDDFKIHMSASIGIALYPLDASSVQDVFKKADLALYAAKGSGKNTWRFYDTSLQTIAYQNMTLINGLREAIERGELFLQYQPLVDIQSGHVISFEALLRWTSPTYGSITPSRFIPLAEKSDTIQIIGNWVIEQACQFARKLADMGKGDIRVAINVSPRQIADNMFVASVFDAIHHAGIKPHQLEFEITENALITSMDDITSKLAELHAHGVYLALDDFGTGYSSLTYLRKLPVDTLKIDKSFIDQIVSEEAQMEFISSIVNMAHVLRLTVVAEGVETEEQLKKLEECRCDFIQGYYFSRPVSEHEAILLLDR